MTTSRSAIHTIRLGPRTRRVVRSVARFVNPVTVQLAGRRWMPVLGVLHHVPDAARAVSDVAASRSVRSPRCRRMGLRAASASSTARRAAAK